MSNIWDGHRLYTKDEKLVGTIVGIDDDHLSANGGTERAVRVLTPSGQFVWLSRDFVHAMLLTD